MSTDNTSGALPADDAAAAEWAAAGARAETATEVHEAADQVSPASFANFAPTTGSTAGNDINMILDIPVQLTVELGRTRIPIKNILQLAQGEVVVVNDKFGIRLTDIVTPSERMRRLSR